MPRQARVVAVGVRHHVTQRGNNRQDIFLLDDDRRFYVETLGRWSQRCGLTLLGYCLMTNHVHLVAVPQRQESLAQALGNTHQLHAQRFNRRYGRSGHAWQNRFFSCPLGPDRTAVALAYCDLNPVRTGLVGRAENWPWSSARAHLEQRDGSGLLDMEASASVRFAAMAPRAGDGRIHGGRDGDESFAERMERESKRTVRTAGAFA
jgi:putative transposase